MNKAKIKKTFVDLLQQEESKYSDIAQKAREDAISGEAKQEAKYDTRAIEASYLAGSLARRKEELTLARQEIENIEIKAQSMVLIGALVTTLEKTEPDYFWITENVGGYEAQCDGHLVRTLSIRSGLGRSLVNAEPGQVIEFSSPRGTREIQIISVV